MPGVSLTQVIGGPCIITYRGATFRSKGDVEMNLALETFGIETSLYGKVDERVRESPRKLKFTPDGEWNNLGVLWPYALTPYGTFITPQMPFFSVAANQVNVGSTAVLQSGDAFVAQVQGSGSITTGLTPGTTYYLHVVSATNISIHSTYANAVAGVNPLTISAGTGQTVGVVNNPLTIQTQDGFLWTFFNAAVTKMPNLSLSTVKTAIGEVEFTAFIADGDDWNATNAVFSYVQNAWPGDIGFYAASIFTGEISAGWLPGTPWGNFDTKDGWAVDFAMDLTPLEVDNVGLVTYRLSDLTVTAKATPIGVQPIDLANALYIQGTNAARGRSLAQFGNNLLLNSVNGQVGVKLFNAALRGGPSVYSNKRDRIGELTWVATRTFSGTGPNPLFALSGSSLS